MRVRVTGHPELYGWMKDLAARTGVVEETRPLAGDMGLAVKLSRLPVDPCWCGVGYLEPVAHADGESALEDRVVESTIA